jgi:hypothetical protein
MTPRAKADYLLIKFHLSECTHGYNDVRDLHAANRCAIIAVDEMLNEYSSQVPKDSYEMERHLYWTEVKNELEKL